MYRLEYLFSREEWTNSRFNFKEKKVEIYFDIKTCIPFFVKNKSIDLCLYMVYLCIYNSKNKIIHGI